MSLIVSHGSKSPIKRDILPYNISQYEPIQIITSDKIDDLLIVGAFQFVA